MYALALRTLRNPEDAADGLQDGLLSAYRYAGQWRGDAQVGTWLYRVVLNACLDRIRRGKVRATVPWPEAEPVAPGDSVSAAEDRLVLGRAMAELPEAQRAAITLVDLYDLSVAEAAQVLGVAEGTVKSRCARGRAALGKLLREQLPSEGNRSSGADVTPLRRRDQKGAP